MANSLIVVESPTKVKTIKKYLGSGFNVVASMGHIKDLPKSTLGIDLENNFEPTYNVIEAKKKTIDELKKAAKSADTIYLAPDPDREGEAIAWHISEIVNGKNKKYIASFLMISPKIPCSKRLIIPSSWISISMKHSRPAAFWTDWLVIKSAPFSGIKLKEA
jgi:reverse gyrase